MKKGKIFLLALASLPLFTSCIDDAEQNTYLTEDRRTELAKENPDKMIARKALGAYGPHGQKYLTAEFLALP